MKILLAIDGSPCSREAVEEVCRRPWPPGSVVKVLSVIHVRGPEALDPLMLTTSFHLALLEEARERAPKLVEEVAETIMGRTGDLKVEYEVHEGNPKEVIVDEAERWGADLILLGSHGHGRVGRFLLGSVSHAVALHAPCSVQIIRPCPQKAEP